MVAVRMVLWLLLLMSLSCYEQAPAASAVAERHVPEMASALSPENTALIRRYERYFRDEMTRTNTVGAALAIVADGKVALCRGYGLRQYGRSDTIDAHTVFRIGSLSKGFTGILSGMMVERNAFRWDDPVRAYCADFRLRDDRQAKSHPHSALVVAHHRTAVPCLYQPDRGRVQPEKNHDGILPESADFGSRRQIFRLSKCRIQRRGSGH